MCNTNRSVRGNACILFSNHDIISPSCINCKGVSEPSDCSETSRLSCS